MKKEHKDNVTSCEVSGNRLDISKYFFSKRAVLHWHSCPVVGSPSLEVVQNHADVVIGMVGVGCS